MNDELVYALIGLGLWWWVGWWGANLLKKYDDTNEFGGLEGQLVLGFTAFIVGGVIGLIAFLTYVIGPRINEWYDNGGRIFKDGGDEL